VDAKIWLTAEKLHGQWLPNALQANLSIKQVARLLYVVAYLASDC